MRFRLLRFCLLENRRCKWRRQTLQATGLCLASGRLEPWSFSERQLPQLLNLLPWGRRRSENPVPGGVQGILPKPSSWRVVPAPGIGWKSRGWRSPGKLVKKHSLVSLKIRIQDSGWRKQTTGSLTSFWVNPASIGNSGSDRESTGR